MRFGRGNLRGGNLIVKTLILPHFLRLPRSAEVVTHVVTYVVTALDHNLSFCRLICILFLLYLGCSMFIGQIFEFLKNFFYRKDPFTTDYQKMPKQNQTITHRRHLKDSRHSVV